MTPAMASDSQRSVLVIEDELPLRRSLATILSTHGYQVDVAETAQQALALLASRPPDLILLDLGLPDRDGVDLTRQIRQWNLVPIIVLSARHHEQDKIEALDAGADDYVTKPFASGELLARMRVALRRVDRSQGEPEAVLVAGDVRVDRVRRQVFRAGAEVRLTPREYRLLTVLLQSAGRVVTHRQLLTEVWGPEHVKDVHYLRIYMAQLRQKLEADANRPRLLRTEPGVGYRLVSD